ncbi:MAG: LysR family transcriptional regulator [Eubacterium sp.]|jgi:Transcriptional regulator|nr:LysR family transcriptional regulator [Eubacterium sp.]
MVYQRIRYFLKAAEESSFSKAAKQMYISSQALTKQIGLLEEEIGGKLFERSSRGVALTPLGEEAFRRFQKIDQELERAVEELHFCATENKKRMNLGIFSALPQETLVTPLISFLLGTYPDYQINLNMVELAEGRQLLMQGKLDLLFTNTHEEDDWNGNQCLCMEEHEAKVMVSLYHPWAAKQEITAEDMRRETFLKMDMDMDHYRIPAADSFYENIPCRKMQRINNFNTLYALLQQGEAFAVFPRAFAYMEQAKIKCFDFPGKKLRFYTALIYNPQGSRNGLGHVVRELAEEFDLKELKV